jgi:hemerythrin-like domain-containing protein
MSRRHDSLIPLSHQHQHALALALIIKRRIGAEKGEEAWREEMAGKIQQLHSVEIAGHFEVEETILFSQMEHCLGHLDLVTELRQEHQAFRESIQIIGISHPMPISILDEFSSAIERHIRKEERQLFAEFEKRMPAEEARKVGWEIDARLAKVCLRL